MAAGTHLQPSSCAPAQCLTIYIPPACGDRQVEPHTAELYAERDWVTLAQSDKLSKLTNDQLK